jgi:hypothetical protein
MDAIGRILEAHSLPAGPERTALARCIDKCLACAATCTVCADACLSEDDIPELVRCIGLDLNCSDVCSATANVLARQGALEAGYVRRLVEACLDICRRCGRECKRHAEHHEHCRICAEACRACADACETLLGLLGTA